jgi:hypothetical protein
VERSQALTNHRDDSVYNGATAEIDRIAAQRVRTPIGPQFMAPLEQAAT